MGVSPSRLIRGGPEVAAVPNPQPYLGVQAINIYVRDHERSLRFYIDQLGFHLAFDARLQSGEQWVAVSPPDGTAVLALLTPKRGTKEYNLIGRSTGVVFVTEDVPGKFREWLRRGVRFHYAPRLRRLNYNRPPQGPESTAGPGTPGEQPPVWGGIFTRFKDVDGNSFMLVGLDKVNREIEARRRADAAKLESERRAAQELEIARQVQARLFPQELPVFKTLEYAGACIQARQVGGDYYDYLDLGRERLGLVIADIAGKGIAAALLMANLQANLRSLCASALDRPRRLLQSVNRIFHENTTEAAYATLFMAEYDDRKQCLRYANCGHLPALVLRTDDSVERLDSTGTVLGLFRDWDCSIGKCRLFPGDILALYTDGITESFNEADDEFGERRLVDALRRHRKQPLESLVSSILDEVRQFSPHEQRDDITLIVSRCKTTTA